MEIMMKKVKNAEMENTLKAVKEKMTEKDVIDSELETLKAEIKDFMNGIGEKAISCGEYTAKISDINRDVVDTKTLKEKYPEIYYNFTTTGTYTKLIIS